MAWPSSLYPNHLYLPEPISPDVATIVRYHKQTRQLLTSSHPQFLWLQRVIAFFDRSTNAHHTLDMLGHITRKETRLLIYLQTFSGVVASADECGQSLDQIASATQAHIAHLSRVHTQSVRARMPYIRDLSERFAKNKRRRGLAKAWNTVKSKDYTLVRELLRSYILRYKLAHARVTCDSDVGVIFVSDPEFSQCPDTDSFVGHLLREDFSFMEMSLGPLFNPMDFGIYRLQAMISGPSCYGFVATKSLSFDGAASAAQILRTQPAVFGVARMDRGIWVQRRCRPQLILSARREACGECWSTEHSIDACSETERPLWAPCHVIDATALNFAHGESQESTILPIGVCYIEETPQHVSNQVRRFSDREGVKKMAQLGPFPLRLSFYGLEAIEAPFPEVDGWVRARISLLHQIKSRWDELKPLLFSSTNTELKEEILAAFPLDPLNSATDRRQLHEQRLRDFASHHILAQVYAHDPSQHENYVRWEQKLFEIRYNMLMPREQSDFMSLNQHMLQWTQVEFLDQTEVAMHVASASQRLLRHAVGSLNPGLYITPDILDEFVRYRDAIYKVDMDSFPELYGGRNFYLNRGCMYFPASIQLHVLSSVFVQQLRRRLESYHASYLAAESDNTMDLINNYASLIRQPPPPPSHIELRVDSVFSLASNFPPCATNLLQHLALTGHLNFKGRQQLVFFLKGIGMPRNEAIDFMRQNLKRSSALEFQLKYKTSISHLYDSDTEYIPLSCSKIISYPMPKQTQLHGCPFKYSSPDSLRKLVHESYPAVQETEIEDLGMSARSGNHVAACQKLFHVAHGKEWRDATPHTYFAKAQDVQRPRVEVEVEYSPA